MVARVLPIKPAPDPQRAKLADVVSNVQMLQSALADVGAQEERTNTAYWEARRTLEQAQAKTAEAETADALSFVDGVEPTALATHRNVLGVLQDRTDAAKKARELLAQRRGQLVAELDTATRKRTAAIEELVRGSPDVRRIIARFRKAQTELHECREAIAALPYDARPLDVHDYDAMNWARDLPPSSTATRVRGWLHALQTDASAELE